jgi:hypothetical protein
MATDKSIGVGQAPVRHLKPHDNKGLKIERVGVGRYIHTLRLVLSLYRTVFVRHLAFFGCSPRFSARFKASQTVRHLPRLSDIYPATHRPECDGKASFWSQLQITPRPLRLPDDPFQLVAALKAKVLLIIAAEEYSGLISATQGIAQQVQQCARISTYLKQGETDAQM